MSKQKIPDEYCILGSSYLGIEMRKGAHGEDDIV